MNKDHDRTELCKSQKILLLNPRKSVKTLNQTTKLPMTVWSSWWSGQLLRVVLVRDLYANIVTCMCGNVQLKSVRVVGQTNSLVLCQLT